MLAVAVILLGLYGLLISQGPVSTLIAVLLCGVAVLLGILSLIGFSLPNRRGIP